MSSTQILNAAIAVLLLATSGPSFAQQSSSNSSEPTVVTEDREFRLRGFSESIEKSRQIDEQFRQQRADL